MHLSDILLAWLKEKFPQLKPQIGYKESIISGKTRTEIHLFHPTSIQFIVMYDNEVRMGLYTFLPTDQEFFNKIEKLIIQTRLWETRSMGNVHFSYGDDIIN